MTRCQIKICGVTSVEIALSAADAGASYIGLVSFPPSPRHCELDLALEIAKSVPFGLCKTVLMVDPSDEALENYLKHVPIDMIQLHGAETPARVQAIKSRFGLPIMKAIGISNAQDLENITEYLGVADQILVDAKPPKASHLPGGNGVAFDWSYLKDYKWAVPWMLAGGLTHRNVAKAIEITGANQIDVSSGVEGSPGIKSEMRIAEFCRAALG